MAKDETRRLQPSQLQSDRDTLAAIASIAGYTPANADYAVARLQAAGINMDTAQKIEMQKFGEADAARDDAAAAEWAFHNVILGAKH